MAPCTRTAWVIDHTAKEQNWRAEKRGVGREASLLDATVPNIMNGEPEAHTCNSHFHLVALQDNRSRERLEFHAANILRRVCSAAGTRTYEEQTQTHWPAQKDRQTTTRRDKQNQRQPQGRQQQQQPDPRRQSLQRARTAAVGLKFLTSMAESSCFGGSKMSIISGGALTVYTATPNGGTSACPQPSDQEECRNERG